MTVMPSSSDVADKAVSTEDASSGAEVARMEAVLAALVENKVEAMKASSGARRAGSAPASPRRLRLTSESTVSSSQHHHHHGHHHQHHEFRNDKRGHRDKRGRHEHRHRRHGSAPCGDYIEDPVTHHHKQRHGKGKQKVPESPRSAKRRRQHSRSPHALSRGEIHPSAASGGIEHQDSAEQELSFINFDRATREALASDPPDLYLGAARLHQSACYISHSTAQIKNHYDDEDYLAFNYADELDEETFSGPAVLSSRPSGEFHKPRRKRRKRRRRTLIDVEGVEVELGVGPDDLPPQARWTIMATACLLLAMSLLLVGVTLRMAPIIDEMARKMEAQYRELDYSRHRLSTSSEERTIFYIDDMSPPPVEPMSPTSGSSRLCEPPDMSLMMAQHHQEAAQMPPLPQQQQRRRNSSSQCGSGVVVPRRRQRRQSEYSFEHSSRRSSSAGRPRANSCARPTPLVRKENEELLNSLNRDSSVPENVTSLPP